MFRALGMGTLKDQLAHYNCVYKGKKQEISPELQELYSYGSEQEINALATLLGKILPVYFPQVTFVEDGCKKRSMGDCYAIISGDGHVVTDSGDCEVTFEMKCPKSGKAWTTDVQYSLPTYYSTQVLSEMNFQECDRYGYISFTPESLTFGTGSNDVGYGMRFGHWQTICMDLQMLNDQHGETLQPQPFWKNWRNFGNHLHLQPNSHRWQVYFVDVISPLMVQTLMAIITAQDLSCLTS